MTKGDIAAVIAHFVAATRRADRAGFDAVEVHGAHGYLISSFLSPLSNTRTDEYGGSFEGRTRFLLELLTAVRAAWPDKKPLLLRLSCVEWVDGGWSLEDTLRLAELVRVHRLADVLDCSSGGNNAQQKIVAGPGYQLPFARAVRAQCGEEGAMAVQAVGLLSTPEQCEAALRDGDCDLVALARQFLRDPFFARTAAHALGIDVTLPAQYERSREGRTAPGLRTEAKAKL